MAFKEKSCLKHCIWISYQWLLLLVISEIKRCGDTNSKTNTFKTCPNWGNTSSLTNWSLFYFINSHIFVLPLKSRCFRFLRVTNFNLWAVSLGDLINPDQLIILYCDQITFESTFSIQIWSRILNRRNDID